MLYHKHHICKVSHLCVFFHAFQRTRAAPFLGNTGIPKRHRVSIPVLFIASTKVNMASAAGVLAGRLALVTGIARVLIKFQWTTGSLIVLELTLCRNLAMLKDDISFYCWSSDHKLLHKCDYYTSLLLKALLLEEKRSHDIIQFKYIPKNSRCRGTIPPKTMAAVYNTSKNHGSGV